MHDDNLSSPSHACGPAFEPVVPPPAPLLASVPVSCIQAATGEDRFDIWHRLGTLSRARSGDGIIDEMCW